MSAPVLSQLFVSASFPKDAERQRESGPERKDGLVVRVRACDLGDQVHFLASLQNPCVILAIHLLSLPQFYCKMRPMALSCLTGAVKINTLKMVSHSNITVRWAT